MREININENNILYRYANWLREKTGCPEPVETICDLTSTIVFRSLATVFVFFAGLCSLFLMVIALTAPVWGWFSPGNSFMIILGLGLWAGALFAWFKYGKDNGHAGIVYEMYDSFKNKTCVKLNVVK